MKISRKIWLPATVGLVVVIGIVVWLVCRNGSSSEGEIVVVEEPVELLYGIEKGKYDIIERNRAPIDIFCRGIAGDGKKAGDGQ